MEKRGKRGRDTSPSPIKKKKSGAERSPSTRSTKELAEESKKHQRRGSGSSKAIAPPPSAAKIKKRSTFHGRGTEEQQKRMPSVDVSKFVNEAKGDLLLRYEVRKIIGKGAYGEVRMVLDKVTNDIRAMKVIPKETCAGNNSSITNEIGVLKTLDHPSILKIYEFYQDEINYYLITEYCSGGELYDRIISMKNFSEVKAAQLMKQILSAVAYCHNRKIVHRYSHLPYNVWQRHQAGEPAVRVARRRCQHQGDRLRHFRHLQRQKDASQARHRIPLTHDPASRTTSPLKCSCSHTTKSATSGAAA